MIKDDKSVFSTKYLSDDEIWKRINKLLERKEEVYVLLSNPEISTDPDKMPKLSKELNLLNKLNDLVNSLKKALDNFEEAKNIIKENKEVDEEIHGIYQDYKQELGKKSNKVLSWLFDHGILKEEGEDKKDIEILKFIEYAGPEYAWRLGINLDLGTSEARNRLEVLKEKGLLERVKGTMLNNYHREKDWTKHMNHTYYKLSHEGELLLREIRKEKQ